MPKALARWRAINIIVYKNVVTVICMFLQQLNTVASAGTEYKQEKQKHNWTRIPTWMYFWLPLRMAWLECFFCCKLGTTPLRMLKQSFSCWRLYVSLVTHTHTHTQRVFEYQALLKRTSLLKTSFVQVKNKILNLKEIKTKMEKSRILL